MRKEVRQYIKSKQILEKFIHEQPLWYRKLTRNPSDLESFELAALQHYQQTIPYKIEKISSSLEMASLMFHMFQSMRQTD
jgi:hypothetical protein